MLSLINNKHRGRERKYLKQSYAIIDLEAYFCGTN